MDEYLITVISAVAAGLLGMFIGWRLQDRRYQRLVSHLQVESGDQSLKLLETRKHLRTISSHLKTNLTKDQTIHQLRRKQKSLLKRIDQQTLQARRTEKNHYIETAKVKLELLEARLEQGTEKNQPASVSSKLQYKKDLDKTDLNKMAANKTAVNKSAVNSDRARDFGHLNGDLNKLLKHAGIRKVSQLASLSRGDIDRLANQQENISAE